MSWIFDTCLKFRNRQDGDGRRGGAPDLPASERVSNLGGDAVELGGRPHRGEDPQLGIHSGDGSSLYSTGINQSYEKYKT